jgi:hypothetical protein
VEGLFGDAGYSKKDSSHSGISIINIFRKYNAQDHQNPNHPGYQSQMALSHKCWLRK